MSAGRTIIKNFVSVTASNIASKILGAVTIFYMARVLGPADFGKLNFALAFISYFAILSHMGLNTLGSRDIAQHPEIANDHINNISSIKLLLGTASFLLLAIIVALMNNTHDIKYLILLYGLTIFTSNVLSFDWVMVGMEKMEYQGAASVIQSIIYMILVTTSIKGAQDLMLVPIILLTAQATAVLFLFLNFKKMAPLFKPRFIPSIPMATLRQTLPIAAWAIMYVINLNIGMTLLGFMRDIQEVGYFSAAYRIISILIEGLMIYSAVIFPTISKYYFQDRAKFQKLLDYTLKFMAITGFPMIAGIVILANPIIQLIYGSKFIQAVPILQVSAFIPYLMLLINIFSSALLAAHRQKTAFWVSFIQAIMLVTLNYIWIPRYGALGLASVTVGVSICTALIYIYELRKTAPICVSSAIKPLVAATMMSLTLSILPPMNLFLSIALGAAVYAAVIMLLKGISKEDIKLITDTLNPRGAWRDGDGTI